MSAYLYHCGTCCWLPLEPNVTRLDVDKRGCETATVLCPVCRRTFTYLVSPAVHRAVWRWRAETAGVAVAEAEQITKEAARE